jgi:hypothetical protein
MEAAFCVETLEHALARQGKPDIVNTDQGSQFTGSAFTGVAAPLRPSMKASVFSQLPFEPEGGIQAIRSSMENGRTIPQCQRAPDGRDGRNMSSAGSAANYRSAASVPCVR